MYLDSPEGYEIQEQPLYGTRDFRTMKAFFQFPPFHSSGLYGMIFNPIQHGIVPVYSPLFTTPAEGVQVALTALDVLAARDARDKDIVVDTVLIVPPCAEYLGKHPEAVDALRKRSIQIGWSGGTVSRVATDVVAPKMNAINLMASTEQGIWPSIRPVGAPPNGESVGYTTPHPALNLRFDPVSESTDGTVLYEAVMRRNDGKTWGGYIQPTFRLDTEAEAKEKRTGDLYAQHPRDPNLWIHYGRADDMLAFLTGQKFFPTVAEKRITGHPGIEEAMMVGSQRPNAALILRLGAGVGVEDVWTLVEEVSRDAPLDARVDRNMVLVVGQPFLKTPKGTVQKRDMLDLYAKELDCLYEEAERCKL